MPNPAVDTDLARKSAQGRLPPEHSVTEWRRLCPKLALIGSGLLLFSFAAANAGVVPVLGLLVAAFAPDAFLVGNFLLIYAASLFLTRSLLVSAVLAIIATSTVGLNTRLATIYSDFLEGNLSKMQIGVRLQGAVGQPIYLEVDTPVISARRYQYAHAMPHCRGDGCLATSGFKTPYPWLESDYWHEKVVDVVLAAGFSLAKNGERAPTLSVQQSENGMRSSVRFELRDADGKSLATYSGNYRQRFPSETDDGLDSEKVWAPLAIEYLLHGNFVNRIVARQIGLPPAYPLTQFLKTATQFSHPQGRTLGLMSPKEAVGSAPPSTHVTLEVLNVKNYDPVWVIKEEPLSAKSKWSELSWDNKRSDRCRTLLKPETTGSPLVQTWYLFVNDPTGRKKVRYTGDALCEADAVWFMDYVIENGRMTLTKYSVGGDLIYRLSFDKPEEPYGYPGAILNPTFKEQNGYLSFEWWNTKQSGYDRHIRRSMEVRVREPDVPPNLPVQGAPRDKAAQRP